MTTRLYIKDRFVTNIEELQQMIEEAGDSPSTVVAKQLIAAACDDVLNCWLKDSLNEKESLMSLSKDQLINLKDTERWKCIKKVLTGSFDCVQWSWRDRIELIKAPADDFWEKLERKEVVHLKFSFHSREIMDERVTLRLLNQEHTLDLNKTSQDITFDIDGKFKGKILRLYIHDDPTPIWQSQREYSIFHVKGVNFRMIRVGGGIFQMGSTYEKHDVELYSFSIGETVVTQELWESVMGNNPCDIKGQNLPVVQVSWYDCQKFIETLNQLTGKTFRLPTEAEWEYAARGGKKGKDNNWQYSGNNKIKDVAWYSGNSNWKTHPVKGIKLPNILGIYGMSGNVLEWCQDWYDDEYDTNKQINPQGPNSGYCRVVRGGSFSRCADECRVSYRNCFSPDDNPEELGFRLVL